MRAGGHSRTARVPLLVGVLLAASCSSIPKPPQDASPEVRMRYGWRLLERGRTFPAREVFEELTLIAPGSAVIDSVRFGLAESYYVEKNYYQARVEYDAVVSSFPRSRLVDHAAFKSALCYWSQSLGYKLDQTETRQAIESFRGFMIDYPTSRYTTEVGSLLDAALNKLARKKLYEGQTYVRLGTPRDFDAAIRILTEMFQMYPGTIWTEEALYYLGTAYFKKGDTDQARQVLAALVNQFPDYARRAEAQKMLEELGPPPGPPPTRTRVPKKSP